MLLTFILSTWTWAATVSESGIHIDLPFKGKEGAEYSIIIHHSQVHPFGTLWKHTEGPGWSSMEPQIEGMTLQKALSQPVKEVFPKKEASKAFAHAKALEWIREQENDGFFVSAIDRDKELVRYRPGYGWVVTNMIAERDGFSIELGDICYPEP